MDITELKAYIRQVGISEMARRTKIAPRTLHYLLSGEFLPSYKTWQKILKDMAKPQ